MKKSQETSKSSSERKGMIALIEEYTDDLLAHEAAPNPQDVLAKHGRKTTAEAMKAHLNMATLLATIGRACKARGAEIMKDKKSVRKARQAALMALRKE